MPVVSFTRMSEGTQADYDLLTIKEREHAAGLPERILRAVRDLGDSIEGYQVSRLEHSLQCATRAHRDGRDDEYIVMALIHDIGDTLAPYSHSELVAAVLRPFVRPEVHWIAKHHGAFQLYYYGKFVGEDPQAREHFRASEWFDACAEFCREYDQVSFDPGYDSLPMESFAARVTAVFAEPRYLNGTGAALIQ